MNPDRLLDRLITGGGDYEAVHRESVEFKLGGHPCRVLGLDALIRAKETLGRPYDLQTVVQSKAVRERSAPDDRS